MALSFIGKHISLISHSDVRYRGILAGIDPVASTIQLSNVYSMGTESRRPPNEFIPPVAEPYQYIIFRASEVKDLAVDDPTPPVRSVHDDPAVLGASAPAAAGAYNPYGTPNPNIPQQRPPPPAYPSQPAVPQATPNQRPSAPPQAPQQPVNQQQQQQQQQQQPQAQPQAQPQQRRDQSRRTNSVHTATASLETVERALGDLRVANQQNANATQNGRGSGGGGRRGGAPKNEQLKVPATEFDFASSNAKFDKAAIIAAATGGSSTPKEGESEGESADGSKEDKAYNPQKSFFDTLSSSAHPGAASGSAPRSHDSMPRGGGGRGRGGGRNRREEERERNITTFGEPGGVGLMGPGAYVGGWGGYGRRGGRPRRGGGPGGGNAGHHSNNQGTNAAPTAAAAR